MQNREFNTRTETKPSLSRQVVERQRDEHEARRGALLPQRNPFASLISGIGDASSAGVHASMLNRATNGRPSRAGQSLLQLQRQYGNRYVQRVLALAGKSTGEAEAAPEVEQSIQQARGGGHGIDSRVRGQMESAFGADFGNVRLHTDTQADTLNRELNARAFTTGQDIFFRQGAYNPGSSSGRELIAHELTHVVQQNGNQVQSKLTVGQPGDKCEQEADRVADQVIRMPDSEVQRQIEPEEEEEETLQSKSLADQIIPLVQRQVEEEEEPIQTQLIYHESRTLQRQEEEELIQTRRTGGRTPHVGPGLEAQPCSLKGGGQYLPRSVRKFFEPRFGHDFSQVRVNTDAKAARLARRVNAKAFTLGRDVMFGSGQYSPDASVGKPLLAHELRHVVQQSAIRTGIQRAWIPDTDWRYTPPASVTRSIIEIQGIVGTTSDGIYGPNTRELVKRYQEELRDNSLYAGDIDGKWGSLTEAAHIAFAINGIGPTAPRRGYNCAGFAFKSFTWHNLAPTRAILSTMTSVPDCSNNCNARDYKFWLWECDVSVTTPDGSTTPTHRDFHIVGGQTGRNGEGPNQVMSKNGQRPVEGPRPPRDWMPASGTAIDQDGNPLPGYTWNISNVDEECNCNDELP